MPELPEVETVMRGLSAAILGHQISRVVVNRPDLRWKLPRDLGQRLTGARVESFRRRGKYILMRTSRADSMLLHLGMSGRIVLAGAPQAHEHVVWESHEGVRAGFVDPRRFGALDLMPTEAEDQHKLLASLGPEPLEPGFTAKTLACALAGKRTPLKAALLDQTLVAGLGNIYVSEALFRARLSPLRLAGNVTAREAAKLTAAIRATLTEAIAAGGSSLRDHVQPNGELGYFQHAWRVYGREGERCDACPGGSCPGIARITQSGRSTFHCARLQR
jgi:formamidopyrimidine-DNA glycosylase